MVSSNTVQQTTEAYDNLYSLGLYTTASTCSIANTHGYLRSGVGDVGDTSGPVAEINKHIILTILILITMFMVLSSWRGHCKAPFTR